MSKAHRLAKAKKPFPRPFPLNFLLGCMDSELAEFETAKLAEIADLRREMQELTDRALEAMQQAAMASWFRSQDRNALKHAIENEESPEEWAKRMVREGQRSAEELVPRPALEPGATHLAAAKRYQERNIAKGKCRYCPKPICHGSVDMCEEHLAKHRARAQQKKALSGPGSREYLYAGDIPSTHGRQPGTLASLAMNREKKTRAVLLEQGLKPDDAAVTLRAAKEAILKCLPDSKTGAICAYDLFQAAQIPTGAGRRSTTGYKALLELLHERKIQRAGKGIPHSRFRYFPETVFGKSLDEPVAELPPRAGRSWR